MEDGLMEFMTMIRGCALVSERNTVDRHPDSAFEPFSEQKHLVMMMERINAAHVTEADPALLDEAMASLRALTTLSYLSLCDMYNIPAKLSNMDFHTLINPTDSTSQLLLGYFMTLQVLMQTFVAFTWSDRDTSPPPTIFISWLNTIYASLDSSTKRYFAWPMAMLQKWQDALTM
ncbi:hypothetical protein LTS18_006722 [Coniosporium uncinatum]|uniref:Uncharacterized protein n=1 Tax=Coniosporium uncinatum TaxID=93489 RepID=A0ACC3DAP0_9PEZI|nr:hypothetical protein LTS18_006722 [Coniosporium uncinatum]